MSRKQKINIKFMTLALVPLMLIAMIIMVVGQASALTGGGASGAVYEWATVATSINNYITSQYGTGADDGEAGFLITATDLKSRIDPAGTNNYLGEGVDTAAAPVLVDVLYTNASLIPGTSVRIDAANAANATVGTPPATNYAVQVANKVQAHRDAGMSTDIVTYCLTGHSQSRVTMAYGAMAQAGYFGSPAPEVVGLKWGRQGWNYALTTVAGPYSLTSAMGTARAGSTYTLGSTANCTGTTPDSELVRCAAQAGLAGAGAGQAGVGTEFGVDLRTSPATYFGSAISISNPLQTLFDPSGTNLAKISNASTILFYSRTQHTALMAAEGAQMLGYTNAKGMRWGLPLWNTGESEKLIDTGLRYSCLGSGGTASCAGTAAVDTSQPVITGTATVATTATTATLNGWTTGEPTTVKVEYGTSASYGQNAYNTVLHANHGGANGVTINAGLAEYTQYYYRITDYDGNANASTTQLTGTFTTADVTPPSVINILPSGPINTNTAVISADYSDASGSGIDANATMVHLDGSNMLMDCPIQTTSHVECNASAGDLTEGTHPIDVYVTDLAGNLTVGHGSLTVDTTAPGISSIVPSGFVTSTSANVSAYYSDSGSGINPASVSVTWDGTTTLACAAVDAVYASCPQTGLPQGAHTIGVSVSDNLGHTMTGTSSVFVDSVTPSVMAGYYPANAAKINTASPTISFTAYDRFASGYTDPATTSGVNMSTIVVTLDGSPASCTIDSGTGAGSCATSGLAEGAHSWNYTFNDNAGNVRNTTRTFTVDTITPVISNNLPTVTSGNTSPTISADYTDSSGSGINSATALVYLDGSDVTSTCTVTGTGVSCPQLGLTDKTYDVTVSVTDNAGNTGSLPWQFTVNTAYPIFDSIVPGAGTWTGDNTPTVTINYHSVTGTIDSASLSIDGLPCADVPTWDQTHIYCTAPTLADGTHTIAGDIAVGANSIPASGTFNVDTTQPTVVYTDPHNFINDSNPTITGTYTDPAPSSGIALIQASITGPGGPYVFSCTDLGGSFSCPVSGLPEGSFTAVVTVDDNTANRGSDAAIFTVDLTGPSISSIVPSGIINTVDADVAVYYSDASSGINTASVSVYWMGPDTSLTASCAVYTDYASCPQTGLPQGSHDINVSVADNTGNVTTGTSTVFVDNRTPSVMAGYYPANNGSVNTVSPTISFTAYDRLASGYTDPATTSGLNASTIAVTLDGSPASCTVDSLTGAVSCATSGLAEGAHSWTYTFNDNAGNTRALTTRPFTVDLTAPVVSNLAPSGDIMTTTPTLTADWSDAVGINTASAVVILDGNPVSGCTPTAVGISCPATVTAGAHTFSVSVNDLAGNTGTNTSGSFNLTQRNYYFPWYDNDVSHGMNGDWIMISNEGTGNAAVDIYIGDNRVAQFDAAHGNAIAPGAQTSWSSDTTLTSGPVRVISTTGESLLVSQRVIYKETFNEIMAADEATLGDSEFYFTWYDNDPANGMVQNWVVVGNVGSSSAVADVYIGDTGVATLNIAAGGQAEWHSPLPLTDGPVKIISRGGQQLIASQRVLFKSAFNEVLAVGSSKLDTESYFTWYDNNASWGMNQNWIIVTNQGTTVTDAEIYIGDVSPGSTAVATLTGINPGEARPWRSEAIVTRGPLLVKSTSAEKLMVSQRVVYKDSLEEVAGTIPADMGNNANFNWYDLQSPGMMGDWLLVGNNASAAQYVYIDIGDSSMTNPANGSNSFPVAQNQSITPWFNGTMNGPARITCAACSGGERFIISQRVIYKNSFNEVIGRPRS